jgi:hypothetical protein
MANVLFALQAYVASVASAGASHVPPFVDAPRSSLQHGSSPRWSRDPMLDGEGLRSASGGGHVSPPSKPDLRR